jgi:hypothetical protein
MGHRRKAAGGFAADALGGGIGGRQNWKLFLQIAQLAIKAVIFLVRDHRPRLNIIEIVVPPDFRRQLRMSPGCLGQSHVCSIPVESVSRANVCPIFSLSNRKESLFFPEAHLTFAEIFLCSWPKQRCRAALQDASRSGYASVAPTGFECSTALRCSPTICSVCATAPLSNTGQLDKGEMRPRSITA